MYKNYEYVTNKQGKHRAVWVFSPVSVLLAWPAGSRASSLSDEVHKIEMFIWHKMDTVWFKRHSQSFSKVEQPFLLLTTSVCVEEQQHKQSNPKSPITNSRSVMTTTHSGHSTAWAGTIQFVSEGCVRTEVWEVKGCPVFMFACQGLLNFRR